MSKKSVRVIREDSQGGNQQFRDEDSGIQMSQEEFIQQIEAGNYPGYHIQNRVGMKVPRSNPDGEPDNNLS